MSFEQLRKMNSKPQSELEWLYYHLWLKTGPAPPQFIFSLPETVFYRRTEGSNFSNPDVNVPENWYFTSKDGYILKKNRLNVSTKEIQNAFTKKMEFHDQIAAVSFCLERNQVEKSATLHTQHLTPSDFRALLFYRPSHNRQLTFDEAFNQPTAIQKFIPCKQIKHTVYRCYYQGDIRPAVVEKLQNAHSMFELKVPLDMRTPTFEQNVDPSLLTNLDSSNVPSQVSDNIVRSVRQIRDHIKGVSKVELRGGVFYFKIDRKRDVLMLFLVTNLELEEEKKGQHTVCLGAKCKVTINAVIKAQQERSLAATSDENFELPNIEIHGKKLVLPFKNASGPQHTSQGAVSVKKPKTCLFCENPMTEEDGEAYEATINQVLKMQTFIKHSQLDPRITQSGFYHSLTETVRGNMCVLFQRAYPKMNAKTYELRRQDPAFIYETVKLCEICYGVMKDILTAMKNCPKKDDILRDAQKHSGQSSKLRPLSYHPNQDLSDAAGSIQQLSQINFHKMDEQAELSKDMRDLLYSIDQSRSILPANISKNQVNMRNSQSQLLHTNGSKGSFSSSVGPLVYSKITGGEMQMRMSGESLGMKTFGEVKSPERSEVASPKNEAPPPKTMVMMFSKVEAGKQVAESVVKIKKDSEDNTFKVIDKRTHASDQEPRVLSNRQLNSELQQRKRNSDVGPDQKVGTLLSKLEGGNDAKALKRPQRIQNGKERPLTAGRQNLIEQQKLRIQKEIKFRKTTTNNYQSDLMRAKKNEIMETCTSLERGLRLPLSQKQEYSSQQIVNIKTDHQMMGGVSDSRMFENFTPTLEPEQRKVSLKPPQLATMDPRRKSSERVESPSNENRALTSKQKLMQAYGLGVPYNIKQAFKATTGGRQRPQSSKPPLQNIYNTQPQQPPFLKQAHSSALGREKSKSARKVVVSSKERKPPTNLLDFNNMTEDHIKEIAAKADQLIEIIQNIKDKVNPSGQEEKDPINNLHQEDKKDGWW